MGCTQSATDEYLQRQFGLHDQVALVTGARHGIGQAVATGLACAGARVAVTGRRESDLAQVVQATGRVGAAALPLALDVRDPLAASAVVEAVLEHFGGLGILVNNAARSARGEALDADPSEWEDVVNTNLSGGFRVAQAAARHMTRAEGGAIVNVSSTYARRAVPGRAAYAASKAGMEQLTRCLAVEWAPRAVRVNAIAPGTVATPSRAGVLADRAFVERRVAETPMGRIAEPDDIVGAILFLVSPAARFITGQVLVVDGGYTVA